jgi:hypothetical protein
MTQTPLEQEEAAATVAAGADLEAGSSVSSQVQSGEAEPWVEPQGSQPSPPQDVDSLEARAGPVAVKAQIHRTPKVLKATGIMVGGILLTTAALVWVATTPARRHPLTTALALRRR